jgi:hypothetical protein
LFDKEAFVYFVLCNNDISQNERRPAVVCYDDVNTILFVVNQQLVSVSPEQSGEYSCTATNDNGSVTVSARLIVMLGKVIYTRLLIDDHRFTEMSVANFVEVC